MEGQSFEKQNEILPQPKVDVKSVLEKGEIESVEKLEGHFLIEVVQMKGDGKGLFKPEEPEWRGRPLRVQLELIAGLIDEILELGLVPEIVERSINNKKGILQRFINVDEARPAIYGNRGLRQIPDETLIKAALFDYLIGAADRRFTNILLSKDETQIWLIDHDDFMFSDVKDWGQYNEILGETKDRKLHITINAESLELLKRLVEKLNQLLTSPKEVGVETLSSDLVKVINNIRQRTQTILETGIIPI